MTELKESAAKGTKSTCGTKRHQLNNGNEVFPSENVSCRRFEASFQFMQVTYPFQLQRLELA